MTHLFRKKLLIQFTLRCVVDFCQVFAGFFLFFFFFFYLFLGRPVGFDCIDS